ncbi:MAG: hypothetical protein JNL92_19955 [Opitutaceae bacterium]|nr:hypothetical protein [Opitutaceae bacterium]
MKYLVPLLMSVAVLSAQDLAPESIAHHAANFSLTPAAGETATVLSGLFTASQSFRFTSSGAPLAAPLSFTWTKTGPTTGTLVETDATRTLTSALTFTAPLTATFRTTSSISPAAQTGTLTLAPIPQPGPPLVNISTRATLAAGQVLNPGFVVGGTVPRRVLVRAVGPTLTRFGVTGVMADPSVAVFRGATQIAANNDWGGGASLVATFAAVSAFALPLDSLDAALVLTLTPGAYTAQVRGTGAGEVIVEVYFVD